MNPENLTARIERLEMRLRNTEVALVIFVFTFGGFAVVRESGWLPVKGSSLEIADHGHSVLTVRRLSDASSLFLHGNSSSESVSIHAGGAGGPSLQVTQSHRGASVLLSAGKDRALAALSTAPDGRRLVLNVGFDGPEVSVAESERSVRRPPVMPQAVHE